jgi:hypothetical protein
VPDAAESVNVEDPDPGAAMLVGLKAAVTPVGRPLADNEIAELKPPAIAAVTMDCPDPPGATVTAVGLSESEKLEPPDAMVILAPAVDVTPPPLPVMVKE